MSAADWVVTFWAGAVFAVLLLWLLAALRPGAQPEADEARRAVAMHAAERREAVGPIDFWLAPDAIGAARREALEGELRAAVVFAGGPQDGAAGVDLTKLQLPPETLAALILIVVADPRVRAVALAGQSAEVGAAIRDLRQLCK
jgi:hypothetical protein